MNKTKIANILAAQYIEAENKLHEDMKQEEIEMAKFSKEDEGIKNEKTFWRRTRESNWVRMNTVKQSVTLLKISEKMWYDALTSGYINQSKAKQSI